MPFPQDITPVDPASQALIGQFSSAWHHAMDSLESRKYERAREEYLELLRLYQEIREKKLDPVHTQIAYSCIEDLYNDLQHHVEVPVMSTRTLRAGICFSILILVLSAFLIGNPSFVGLTIAEPEVTTGWTGPATLTINKSTTINLNDFAQGGYTYLVTKGIGVDVYMDGPVVTLIPREDFKGKSLIKVFGYETVQGKLQLAFEKYVTVNVK